MKKLKDYIMTLIKVPKALIKTGEMIGQVKKNIVVVLTGV